MKFKISEFLEIEEIIMKGGALMANCIPPTNLWPTLHVRLKNSLRKKKLEDGQFDLRSPYCQWQNKKIEICIPPS
jgi:hypothetical protein